MKLGHLTLMDGMLLIEPEATVESIESSAQKLFFFQKNAPWWIGDLVMFGEARWGDELWQVVPEGTSEEMIGRYVAQSRKMKPSQRVPAATWTMHSIAAKIKDSSLRKAMLNHAVCESMNTDEFRTYVTEMTKNA